MSARDRFKESGRSVTPTKMNSRKTSQSAGAIKITDLYSDLTDEQQSEVALHFARYIDVICSIHESTKNLTEVD